MATLILDYDGTLHESLLIYAPAFRLAYDGLVQKGLAPTRIFEDDEISRWLGLSAKDMWHRFMPELSQKEKDTCSAIIGEEMLRLTRAGKSKLYPHALDVLDQLKSQGHELVFLSNCKRSYMQAHREYWQLDRYFSAFYCTENFDFAPKWKIFDSFKEECSQSCIIVGDRIQDMEVATKHGLLSIGCTYGYGNMDELKQATILAGSVEEIPQAVSNLLKEK